jgi:3-methyladenine DNA glycosylase/8-oxoguanine DNA glycosylase
MLLMYSLERMDVLPVDHFGVRDGYRKLKYLAELPKPSKLREIGKAWAPHRRGVVSLAHPARSRRGFEATAGEASRAKASMTSDE